MLLDSKIWGPKYWFFMHTAAMAYPLKPTEATKRKFYDLIQNFPLFIPDGDIASYFTKLMGKYPVSPYLDSRDSLIRWTHFIHNKVNEKLEKKQISLAKFYEDYHALYKPKIQINRYYQKMKKHIIYILFVLFLIVVIYRLYL